MKPATFALPAIAFFALVSSGPVLAAAGDELAVPGYPVAADVPGAHELPDPNIDYKIAWGIGQGPDDPTGDVNPALPVLARYVNTLAKWGVPPEKRHIIAIFHQRSPNFNIVLSNEAFRAKFGKDNPNIALIDALTKAGVEFRACGQAVVGRKIDPADVNPEIQIDLWAMTSFMNLQMKGYVRAGN